MCLHPCGARRLLLQRSASTIEGIVDPSPSRGRAQRTQCMLPHLRHTRLAFRKRMLPVCSLLSKRDPLVGQQLPAASAAGRRRRAVVDLRALGAVVVSRHGAATTLRKGVYHRVTLLSAHRAGKRAAGAIGLPNPHSAGRKPARTSRVGMLQLNNNNTTATTKLSFCEKMS